MEVHRNALKTLLLTQADKRVLLAVVRAIYRKTFRPSPQYTLAIDRQGIPIVCYRDIGPQRNPVTTCIYAMKYYRNGNRHLFLNCANWLIKNLSNKRTFSVWEYNFPWRMYNLKPPWVSGMAQGLGLEVFASAHKISGDDRFLKCAFEVLKAFTVPVKKGGVLQVDEKDGGWWFEECASPNSVRSYILNGHIYALEGIYEFYSYMKDKLAKKIYDAGVAELKRHVHEYDAGSWTYYDRLRRMANYSYHMVHIEQMDYLWKTTGDILFKNYYEIWKAYAAKPFSKLLHE